MTYRQKEKCEKKIKIVQNVQQAMTVIGQPKITVLAYYLLILICL